MNKQSQFKKLCRELIAYKLFFKRFKKIIINRKEETLENGKRLYNSNR